MTSDEETAEGLARRFTPVDIGGTVAGRKKAILAALVQVRAEGMVKIERLKTSRDLCEKGLDVLDASHKDLAHRLARAGEENERLRIENAELKAELVKRLRALADATLPQ